MKLTRTYNNEKISIDFAVNEQPNPEPYEDTNPETGEKEESLEMHKTFVVHITKGENQLVYEVLFDGEALNIMHLGYEPKDGYESDSYYTGPVFAELDQGLQQQSLAMLEERGITAELAAYITELIDDKEQQEYMAWLKKVHDFLAA